jgi:hypothetical protein
MYTGTLIRDLMAAVEQAERDEQLSPIAEETELQRMFELQVPSMQGEQVFAGAA